MKKAYFQYYETFEAVVQKFKTAEERETMRTIIINYGLYGDVPETMDALQDMAFTIVKELIDQQMHRREINAENRKKRETKKNENNEVNEKKENNEPKEKKQNFQAPTIDEINKVIKEKNYTVSAETFFNFYESNGWHVGKNKMKSWKAALQGWQAREDKQPQKMKAQTVWNTADSDTAMYDSMF